MKDTNWPQFKLINFFGHWPGKGLRGKLDRVVSTTVVFFTFMLFAAEGFSTKNSFSLGDLQSGLVNLNELISAVQCFVACFAFLFYKEDIAVAVTLIEDVTERILGEVEGTVAVEEIGKRRKRARWTHLICFWSFVVIFHWALTPLIHLAIYGETVSIVHSWLPFDNASLSGFFGNFVFQLIPCTSFCMCLCMFGSVFVSLSELILGHFKILKYRLSSVKYGQPGTRKQLVLTVKHHEDILKICQIFQQMTAIPLIAFCLLTVLVLCVILFEVTCVESTTSIRIINLLEEAQQELFFLALFCWYGNEITYQCGDLLTPGYMADWYDGTDCEKKMLLSVMTRTMTQGYFGGFIRIDMITFINVLKAAFSYFNFLLAVNSQQEKEFI